MYETKGIIVDLNISWWGLIGLRSGLDIIQRACQSFYRTQWYGLLPSQHSDLVCNSNCASTIPRKSRKLLPRQNRPCVVHLLSTAKAAVRLDGLGEHPSVFVSLLEPRPHNFLHRDVQVHYLAPVRRRITATRPVKR